MKSKLLLRFDPHLKEQLAKIAERENRSLTSQIVYILTVFCKNHIVEKKGGI